MSKFSRIGSAVWAGLWGTVAMTLLMYGWPLVGLPKMDIMAALGGAFGPSPYIAGAAIHFGIGISLALIYSVFFEPWLPGPGWVRGALFSIAPWIFAITLLTPTLQMASDFFVGRKAVTANPCAVANPCAIRPANPCAVKRSHLNPCSAAEINPCAVKSNPCAAANPCGGSGGPSKSGLSPQAMSLMAHLFYGVVLGIVHRRSDA